MSVIDLYIELHYGKRRPNVDYYLNNKKIIPFKEKIVELLQYQDKMIVSFEAELYKDNIFEIRMSDKKDNDMLNIDNVWIDHFIKIREMSVDGIHFETALYNFSGFTHSMPREWVDKMKNKNGIEILDYYPNSCEIRLNGIWKINFSTPVWQWQIEKYSL
jgi:hypothetical protein